MNKAREEGLRSFLSVPLLGNSQRPLGTLSIYDKTPRDFSESEEALCTSFANQVATAFENFQLIAAERKRQKSFKRLANIGHAVTCETISGLRPVLKKAAESACKLIGADYAAIYPYDPDRKDFYDRKNVVIHGLSEDQLPNEKPRPSGLAYIVKRLGELVVHDINRGKLNKADFNKIRHKILSKERLLEIIREEDFIKNKAIQAFIGLSLKTGHSKNGKKEVAGVLYIDYCKPHEFEREELDLIHILSHQIGSAIHIVRLLYRDKKRAELLEALQETQKDLLAQRDPDMVLTNITTSASRLMTGKKKLKLHGAIWSCDYETQTLKAEHSHNKDMVGVTLKFGEGLAGLVAKKCKSRIIPDYRAWPGRAKVFNQVQLKNLFRSLLAVPLFWENRVIGVLSISSRDIGVFDDEDKELLKRFASSAAIALQNTKLYEALGGGVSSLFKIRREGTATLKEIAKNTLKILGADIVIIYEYFKGRDDEFKNEPIICGKLNDRTSPNKQINDESIVARAVELNDPHFSQYVQQDNFVLDERETKASPIIQQPARNPFIVRERIKSSAIIPLKVEQDVMGVMFVNYRDTAEFTDVLKAEINIFSYQAALAIGTARTFSQISALQRIGRKIAEVGELGELDNALTSALSR